MISTHTCAWLGTGGKSCPNLAEPGSSRCATHQRNKNAHWSRGRSSAEQARFRKHTLGRDNYTCQRCGHHDPTGRTLDAHHATPTTGVTLCNSKANGCHRAVDHHAR